MNSDYQIFQNDQESICIPQSACDWLLEQIDLSVRLAGVLERLGCVRLGDLNGLTWREVSQAQNCGRKTLRELQSLVADLRDGRLDKFAIQVGQSEDNQPAPVTISIPQHAQGWLLSSLPISVRLAGVLERMERRLLGDLHGLSFREIRKVKNCGRGTIAELKTLISRIQSGEFDSAVSEGRELDLAYLVLSLNEGIGKLNLREREMLLLRLGGLENKPLTLEELGATYGLTRERIRQIVSKVIPQLQKSSGPLVNRLLKALAERCLAAVCPLTPELFTHWLGAEASVCRFTIPFYVRLMVEMLPEIPAWPEGQKRSANISERSRQIIRNLRELLRGNTVPTPLPEAYRKLMEVGNPSRLQVGEFLEALQRGSSLKVEFITPEQPVMRVAKLRTLEWVSMVLSQSDYPLTPEEIIERARHLLGDDFDPITAFSLGNILKPEDGFYLLDRRAFGLRKHFRLPSHLWGKIRSDFYLLLREEDRPISTSEVIEDCANKS